MLNVKGLSQDDVIIVILLGSRLCVYLHPEIFDAFSIYMIKWAYYINFSVVLFLVFYTLLEKLYMICSSKYSLVILMHPRVLTAGEWGFCDVIQS